MADLSQFLNGGGGGGLAVVSSVIGTFSVTGNDLELTITPAASQYVGISFSVNSTAAGNFGISANGGSVINSPYRDYFGVDSSDGAQNRKNFYVFRKGQTITVTTNNYSSPITVQYTYVLLEAS